MARYREDEVKDIPEDDLASNRLVKRWFEGSLIPEIMACYVNIRLTSAGIIYASLEMQEGGPLFAAEDRPPIVIKSSGDKMRYLKDTGRGLAAQCPAQAMYAASARALASRSVLSC
jgi:hypothetical protein